MLDELRCLRSRQRETLASVEQSVEMGLKALDSSPADPHRFEESIAVSEAAIGDIEGPTVTSDDVSSTHACAR
jgi:hypothetical protein